MRNEPNVLIIGEKSHLSEGLTKKFSEHYKTYLLPFTDLQSIIEFVSVFRPDCLISLVGLKALSKTQEFLSNSSSIQNALIGTDSLFIELLPLDFTDFPVQNHYSPYSSLVQSCFIKLGYLHSPLSLSFISVFLEKCRNKKSLTIEEGSHIPLLSERKLPNYLLNFVNKAFIDKSLSGYYDLFEGLCPTTSEVLSEALNAAKRIYPEHYFASLKIKKNTHYSDIHLPDNTRFQSDSELILANWKDGITETTVGYIVKNEKR